MGQSEQSREPRRQLARVGQRIHFLQPTGHRKSDHLRRCWKQYRKKKDGNGKSLVMESIGRFKSYAFGEIHYSDHLSTRGDSKMDRRWQKGPAGQQRPHVRVTTDLDVKWLKASPECVLRKVRDSNLIKSRTASPGDLTVGLRVRRIGNYPSGFAGRDHAEAEEDETNDRPGFLTTPLPDL